MSHAERLPIDSPVITAQRIVTGWIFGSEGDGVVQERLADLRALAGMMLSLASASSFLEYFPSASSSFRSALEHEKERRAMFQPSRVDLAAAALTWATTIMASTDIAQSVERLEPLMITDRESGLSPTAVARDWGPTSDRLREMLWKARSQHMTRVDQLRYATSVRPQLPSLSATDVLKRAQYVPQLFWASAALQLVPREDMHWEKIRLGLSAITLLPGSRDRRLGSAARALGMGDPSRSVNHSLNRIASDENTTAFAGICKLASYLDDGGCPIDYARRRALSFDKLLPKSAWTTMSRNSGIPPASERRHLHARRFLFERITGTSLRFAPAPIRVVSSADQAESEQFILLLNRELLDGLDSYARAFLARRGIHEPLTWQPPNSALGLPESTALPSNFETDELHSLLFREHMSMQDAARRLGTRLETVRLRLELEPPPVTFIDPKGRPSNWQRNIAAREVFTVRTLVNQTAAGNSLTRMAKDSGFGRTTLSRRLKEHGIQPPPPGRRPREISREFLVRHYVDQGESAREIAAQIGMSPSAVLQRLRREGIQTRSRGGGKKSKSAVIPRDTRQSTTTAG